MHSHNKKHYNNVEKEGKMAGKNEEKQKSVYMHICYQIIEDVINGKYEVGDVIPTQNELAEAFRVSRATVREAIKELIHRGILQTVKGKGTFVLSKPGEVGRSERSKGFSGANFRNIGKEKHTRVVVLEEILADKMLSTNLMIPIGNPVVHIKRVRYVDQFPMCVDDAYLAKRYIGEIDFQKENLEEHSLYKVLEEKADIYIDFIEEKFRGLSCDEENARLLGINAGEPILGIRRVSSDTHGRIIEYCENYERSDMFCTVIQSKRSNRKKVGVEVYDKIYGSFLGAAVGDAMGAVTETKTTDMILEKFGGYIEDFVTPPDDCYVRGRLAGSVTDDFSLAYFTAFELIKCKGKVTEKVAENSLLTWSEYPEFFSLAGPTTQCAVLALKGKKCQRTEEQIGCNNMFATDGAAMKIFPVGLINPGNLDKAIEEAAIMCMPTHPYNVTISSAAAIAAAVAKAMEANVELDDVLEAGIYGAKRGYELGNKIGKPLAVPSVEKRIKLAVEIGKKGLSWEETMRELADVIGSGISASEAIPCAFGILAANPNDTMGAIRMSANIGNDTDTIGTMVGAIAGALYGAKTIPEKFLDTINNVNGFDLERVAQDIAIEYYE